MRNHTTYENDLESLDLDGMLRTPYYYRQSVAEEVPEKENNNGSEDGAALTVGGTLEKRKTALLEEVERMLERLDLEVAFDTVADDGHNSDKDTSQAAQGKEEEELEEGEIQEDVERASTPQGNDGKKKTTKKKTTKKKKKKKQEAKSAQQPGGMDKDCHQAISNSSSKENVEGNLKAVTRVTRAGGRHIRFHD
ncbi:hypothetical protein M9435_001225 [Picochlorum sp. BPE23]|nr:hypothetical protein M9435_001225 [Picochlorum sp. BPE23]